MHRPHRLAFAAALLPLLAAAPAALAQGFPRLYCPDGTAGSGSELRCFIDQELELINPLEGLGISRPVGMASSAQHDFVYVANLNDESYSVLRVVDGGARLEPVRDFVGQPLRIDLGATPCNPVDLAVTGDKLYVACLTPPSVGSSRTEEGHLEIFRKGNFGYIDFPSDPSRIDVDPNPGEIDKQPFTSLTDLQLNRSGSRLYVSYIEEQTCGIFNFQFGSVAVIDTATEQVLDKFPDLPPCGRENQEMLEPLAMALSPDESRLYLTLHKSSPPHVAEIALNADGTFGGSNYTRLSVCTVANCSGEGDSASADPAGLLVSRDGAKLYVTHNGYAGLQGVPRFRISVLSTVSRTLLKRLDLPGINDPGFIDYNPTAPAYTQSGSRILVPLFGDDSNPGNHVVVLDPSTDTLDLASTIVIPRSVDFADQAEKDAQPISILVHPASRFAYVTSHVPSTISVLETAPDPSTLGLPTGPGLAALALGAALAGLHLLRRRRALPARGAAPS